jgi:hypothetical protein
MSWLGLSWGRGKSQGRAKSQVRRAKEEVKSKKLKSEKFRLPRNSGHIE